MSDEMDIIDELREAADQFQKSEFHDDMPISEVQSLLRRAAQRIADLQDTLEAYGR